MGNIDEFKELIYQRCCEVGTKVAETKGKRFLSKGREEIFEMIFSEIAWYLDRDIIRGSELVEIYSPDELLSVGFLTQENYRIDFSEIVNIGGINWFNENEPCGVLKTDDIVVYKEVQLTKKEFHQRCSDYEECRGKEDCMGFKDMDKDDETLLEELPTINFKFPKGKRLPNKDEMRVLTKRKENIGYYNGTLCKIYDKKLVLPFLRGVCYLGYDDTPLYEECFLSLTAQRTNYSDFSEGMCFIRCVQKVQAQKSRTNEPKKKAESSSIPKNTPDTTNKGEEDFLRKVIEQEGVMQGALHYKNSANVSLTEAKRRVDEFVKKNNIKPYKGGCLTSLIIFIIATIGITGGIILL